MSDMKMKTKEHAKVGADLPLALRLPPEIILLLDNAKKATGRTKKHLLSDAILSKYGQYRSFEAA
jgi:predicted DNA-binding protein